MRMGSGEGSLIGHVARMEEGRSAFKILAGKPTVKGPLGRSRLFQYIMLFPWKQKLLFLKPDCCLFL